MTQIKKRLSTGPGLVIGIPTLGRPVPLDWAFALRGLSTPINFNVIMQVIKGSEVAPARNAIAQLAIEKDAKYLFFLGDDVVVPAFTLKQLIHRMENNPELGVAGGVYVSKTEPPTPLVFRGNGQGAYWDWKIGEFFPVTGMGMDCTLIRVSVLKEMLAAGCKELFKTVDTDNFLDAVNTAESWTEDLYFFGQMEKYAPSYSICIDAGIICHHWDVYGDKSYTVPFGSLPMRQLMFPVHTKKCLVIGNDVDISEKADFEVVKYGPFEGADYRGEETKLPFDAETFDWVVVNNPKFSTNYIEWERVLKQGGKLSLMYHPLIDKSAVKAQDIRLQDEPNGMLVLYKEDKCLT